VPLALLIQGVIVSSLLVYAPCHGHLPFPSLRLPSPQLSLLFHPPSTPWAVAREAGGGQCVDVSCWSSICQSLPCKQWLTVAGVVVDVWWWVGHWWWCCRHSSFIIAICPLIIHHSSSVHLLIVHLSVPTYPPCEQWLIVAGDRDCGGGGFPVVIPVVLTVPPISTPQVVTHGAGSRWWLYQHGVGIVVPPAIHPTSSCS
jgi:hypothetical protein